MLQAVKRKRKATESCDREHSTISCVLQPHCSFSVNQARTHRMLASVSGKSKIPKGTIASDASMPCGRSTFMMRPEFFVPRGGTTSPGLNVCVKVAKTVPLRPACAVTLSSVISTGSGFWTVLVRAKKNQLYLLGALVSLTVESSPVIYAYRSA